MKSATGYGDPPPAATHEAGAGDPSRDTAGCENGQLCPKMANQPCPLSEGCPMHKGAVVEITKRGRMISAANESTLRTAAAQINSILDRLASGDTTGKAWPPGAPGAAPQSGTGFPTNPPPPQPGVEAQQKPADSKESDKVTTSAGLMVAFLANLAAQTASLLEQLSPLTGDPNAEDDEDAEPSDKTSGTSGASKPFPPAKGVVKTVVERDGAFQVLQTLGTYATREEALAQLVEKSTADAVDEFLLEIEDEVAASSELIDLGDLTAKDLSDVINKAVHSRARASVEAQDRIRRGRVD